MESENEVRKEKGVEVSSTRVNQACSEKRPHYLPATVLRYGGSEVTHMAGARSS